MQKHQEERLDTPLNQSGAEQAQHERCAMGKTSGV